MLKLLVLPRAEQDLAEIYTYTLEEWGIQQADRYQDELFKGMQTILNNPLIGKTYQHPELPYRMFHINRHLIFYRIQENNCLVVRVLHDSMNITAYL